MIVVGLGNDMPKSYGQHVNRYATVPCLYDSGVAVYESAIVAEYIDSKWNNGTLFGRDSPAMMQLIRLLAAKFEIGAFYGLLRCQEEGEKRAALEKQIHDTMTELETIYRENAAPYRADGPYLLGSRLSAAEIMIMPFVYRFNGLLQHYRKFEFVSKYPLVAAAFAASEGRPGFKESCRDMEFYIEKYRSYAIPAAPWALRIGKSHSTTYV